LETFTIHASLRSEFDRRWREFTNKKYADMRERGTVVMTIVDPIMQGPNPDGRVVYRMVDPEFANDLRAEGFGS
jgi:hypothetical protein